MTTQSDDDEEKLEPEAQARVDRWMHALEHNPAITCGFKFSWTGSQELAQKSSELMCLYAVMMRDEWPEMTFESLKLITFHHDYELALREAVGPGRQAPTPTKEAGGLSVGMMVRISEGVGLVMHESVGLHLAGDDPFARAWAQQVVRHELCHVSDFTFKRRLIAKNPSHQEFVGYDSHMAPLAETMWDEFYANKYSTGDWSDPRTFLDLLRDALPQLRGDIVGAILAYRTDFDLHKLLQFAEQKTKFAAQCFGYAAGSLSGSGRTLAEDAPEEHALLAKLGLLDAWDQCFAVLVQLDTMRPDWGSVLELNRLFPGCRALFAGFGLQYSPTDDGAHVNVPFTRETHPWFAATGTTPETGASTNVSSNFRVSD